jgi:hypothetical protein
MRLLLCLLWMLAVSAEASAADTATFDPKPWLADLQQIRVALSEKYANLDWAVFEREIDLTGLFVRTEARLQQAHSDAEAREAIDDLTGRFGDGHLEVRWPVRAGAEPQASAGICSSLGYDARMSGHVLLNRAPGYEPLADDAIPELPSGLIQLAGHRLGVIRIGLFDPRGFPQLCEALLKQMGGSDGSGCDSRCADRLEDAAYGQMSRDLAARVRELRRRGATALLIDLTGNGGGSEWAEAAARIVSPVRLRSERLDFVRGAHWVDHWRTLGEDLHRAAQDSPEDRDQLLRWAGQVDQAQRVAATPCPSMPFWSGQRPPCSWLGQAFYATGVLAEGDAAALRRKPWGSMVFSPAEFDFEERVWRGPLLVLID